MARFCGSCGLAMPEGAAFCEGCGATTGPAAVPYPPRSPGLSARSGGFIGRFWGFDLLIGSALVKLIYYLGMAGIGIAVLVAVLGSLSKMGSSPTGALGVILVALIVGSAGLVLWRFTCELAVLAYQIYNRLGEIRDRLPPPTAER